MAASSGKRHPTLGRGTHHVMKSSRRLLLSENTPTRNYNVTEHARVEEGERLVSRLCKYRAGTQLFRALRANVRITCASVPLRNLTPTAAFREKRRSSAAGGEARN